MPCVVVSSPRVDVLGMIEDHVRRNVVRVPAAGASGRGAYFRQVRGGRQFQVVYAPAGCLPPATSPLECLLQLNGLVSGLYCFCGPVTIKLVCPQRAHHASYFLVRSILCGAQFLETFYLKFVWDGFCCSSADAIGNTMFQTSVYKLLVSTNK